MQNKDSNYIIYKICCNDLKLSKYFYIGYTQNFRQCTYWHKKNCINRYSLVIKKRAKNEL